MSAASFRLWSAPAYGNKLISPLGGFEIDNLSEQEDILALLGPGVPSVYRTFVGPRRVTELARCLNPDARSASKPEGWMAVWREFLAGVTDALEVLGADRPDLRAMHKRARQLAEREFDRLKLGERLNKVLKVAAGHA